MDQEVAKTLSSLELKLAELERELTSIGRREPAAEPQSAPGKLIDEAIEHEASVDVQRAANAQQPGEAEEVFADSQAGARDQERHNRNGSPSEGYTPPAAPPAQTPFQPAPSFEAHPLLAPSATPPTPPPLTPSAQSSPAPFTPAPSFEAHPPPTPPHHPLPEERQSIDIADLVRFRDKLANTMDELIDEYSRLLLLQPPVSPRRTPDA